MRARKPVNRLRFPQPRIQPHVLFFWAYNFIYLLPLVAIYLWGYTDTGAVGQIGLDSHSIRAIWFVYAQGLGAFTLGAVFVSLVLKRLPALGTQADYRVPDIGVTEILGSLFIVAVFITAKAALIPLGVYREYAFNDTDFKNSIWSFSMVCSEFMLLTATLFLFSDARRRRLGFAVFSILNCVNLLHGTRIFFIVNLLILVLYVYMRGKLTLRRVLLYGPPAFVAVLLLTYAVFLSRSGVTDNNLNAAGTASPLVYESLFSQISLRNVVTSPDLVNSSGSISNFATDVVASLIPRVLMPGKDDLQYLDRFAYMSPLGAFNGYAAGVIYFGLYWPLFYLVLGAAASWLYAKARTNPYWLVLYAYFTGDVLFRFMRDGYTIPIKILVNIIELLAMLFFVRAVMRGLPRPSLQA